MKHSARLAGSAVIIGAVVAYAAPAYAATATQVPVASTGFFGGFMDVSAVSASDGWAVGSNGNGFVQRFNGTRWSVVASPDLLGGASNSWAGLSGVDALSASTAYAVGSGPASDGTGTAAVALRWNGWSRLTVPRPAGTNTEFTAVAALPSGDVWAVGETSTSSVARTLAMRYRGGAWTLTPTPSPGTRNNVVTAVDGVASNDVWAVGYSLNLPYGNRIRQSMILHWDGSSWRQVASPNSGSTYLWDVAAVSANDAWAVGYGSTGAFVLRWNGTAWNVAPAPALSSLRGGAARSGTDVWVAGGDANGAPAVARWNGSGWTVTPVSATGGVGASALTKIAVAGPVTEFAVGYQSDGTTGQSSSIAFRITG